MSAPKDNEAPPQVEENAPEYNHPVMTLNFSHGMVLVNPDFDEDDPQSSPGFIAYDMHIEYNPIAPYETIAAFQELLGMIAVPKDGNQVMAPEAQNELTNANDALSAGEEERRIVVPDEAGRLVVPR